MNRRDFVSTAMATGAALLSAGVVADARQNPVGRGPERAVAEYYELRRYRLRRGPGQGITDTYLRTAALPAWQRAGVGPIGVFSVTIGADSPTLYVLLVHKSLDGIASLPERLAGDAEYEKAATPYLTAEATAPAFVRVDASLMRPFEGMPKLELPFGGGENARRSRIFELRTYESHSEKASKKKIEMFNRGEIAIFRRAGLTPVFFGETLIGGNMPNLTYMLVYEDMAARDKQWSAFGADPEWKKLSTTPGYTDPEIVSNISNTYLRPTGYSQI
jgi:NIPSNAP protein